MKVLKKETIYKRNQVIHTKTERKVLELLEHPFLVKLRYSFQNAKKLYMVMDYVQGGELFFHLSNEGRFTDERARFYAAQMLIALGYIHSKNIIYRDLKPENILINTDGYIKLTDFGLSKELIDKNGTAKSFCGTPEYLAPEVLQRKPYGRSIDWWSLGCLIYEMLYGMPPFYSQDRNKLFQNILFTELKFPAYFKPDCVDLLKGLLDKDPLKRLGGGPDDYKEIVIHPWFGSINWDMLSKKQIHPVFKPIIKDPLDISNHDSKFTEEVPNDSMQNATTGLEPGSANFKDFSYQTK
jgi:serine/threonine protein kinase